MTHPIGGSPLPDGGSWPTALACGHIQNEHMPDASAPAAARPAAGPPAGRWALFGIVWALIGLRIVGFVLFACLVASTALLVIWIGIPLLLGSLAALRGFAKLHRRLAGKVLGTTITEPYPAEDPGRGVRPDALPVHRPRHLAGPGLAAGGAEHRVRPRAVRVGRVPDPPARLLGIAPAAAHRRRDHPPADRAAGRAPAGAHRSAGDVPGGHGRPLRRRAPADRTRSA